jgi:NAD(P)-dependent dehydrogenase (short-subunit alcohol dehydrogenase family)
MGRVAIVTGASAGIGRAVSLALFERGYSVALTGRRKEKLEETAALAGAGLDRALIATGDVADEAAVKGIFSQVESKFGRLDLLFNNAGILAPSVPIEELPVDTWRRVVDTNLTGAFLFTQEAVRLMKKQSPRGGRIINNGSISAQVPRPNSIAYSATKHAMTGMTKSTALDGRPFNIACGQIDIGNVATSMTAKMEFGALQPNGTIQQEPTFDMKHVVSAVMCMAELPLDTNVLFMTVMASGMPFVGRG